MHLRKMTLFLVAVLLLAGCTGLFFEEPTITLKEIHVRQLSLTDASLVFVAEIQNPNSYELRLKSLDYTIHLNDRETGGGSLQKEISVPASSSASVEIPVSCPLRQPGRSRQNVHLRPGASLPDRRQGPREGRPLRPYLPLLPHRHPVHEKVLKELVPTPLSLVPRFRSSPPAPVLSSQNPASPSPAFRTRGRSFPRRGR